jgi:SAM-dependent methyltransferase
LQEISKGIDTENKNLLDVGCGDGNFVSMARKMGIEAWGIDKEPRVSNKYISAQPVESFGADNRYDLITMFHVLEHLKNPLSALSKLSGCLKRGGYLVIEVPLVGNWSEKFLRKEYFAYFDKTHINLWQKQEWLVLIRKAGLTPIRQGMTCYEFPLSIISGGFRLGILHGIVGLVLFVPFKALTWIGFNEEIIRIYCIKTPKK